MSPAAKTARKRGRKVARKARKVGRDLRRELDSLFAKSSLVCQLDLARNEDPIDTRSGGRCFEHAQDRVHTVPELIAGHEEIRSHRGQHVSNVLYAREVLQRVQVGGKGCARQDTARNVDDER